MLYTFSVYNQIASTGIAYALKHILDPNRETVILCIGSDLSVGDSLGPLIGSKLRQNGIDERYPIYGTLQTPVTAKETRLCPTFLQTVYPNHQILAIDAAVGQRGDTGLIKIQDKPLDPGKGCGKNLPSVGDAGILGIVGDRSITDLGVSAETRMRLIVAMADCIVRSIEEALLQKRVHNP